VEIKGFGSVTFLKGMTVSSPVYIGIFFLALSIIFLGAVFHDYLKTKERERYPKESGSAWPLFLVALASA